MEFLVYIDVRWPVDGDRTLRDELIAAESIRAGELAAEGILKRIWRRPGRWANIALWETSDATALHEALSSLPFYPWLYIDVVPLALHPNDPSPIRKEHP